MSHRSLLVAIFTSVLPVVGCSIECDNEIQKTLLSPDGQTKAVVFQRNCGATTGFNTQVTLLPLQALLPNEGGNVFVYRQDGPIQVHWQDARTLVIGGFDPQKVGNKQAVMGNITIRYE